MNIKTIILGEDSIELFPEQITIQSADLSKTFYMSYRAYIVDTEDPDRIMIEYRDIQEEMKEMDMYQHKYGDKPYR